MSIFLLATLTTLLPFQEGAEVARADVPDLEDRVRELTLDNGWRFLLVQRANAPVVSFETYVEVGSVQESPGLTGMAHMFEHMAFKGSDRIGTLDWEREQAELDAVDALHAELVAAQATGDEETILAAREAFDEARDRAADLSVKEEFSRLLEDAGASSLNATTSAEETRYIVSLPANQVELWCWLEAERFKRGVLREFYRERDAVMEERRMRVESSPLGTLVEKLLLSAFLTHPYRHPTIGYPGDIAGYSRAAANTFFDENYGARRIVTAIVGDIDPEALEKMLVRYFADVPPGPAPEAVAFDEPEQNGERRIEVAFPANPILAAAWHVPALAHPDSPAVDVAVRLLGEGRSSRLERRLIREDGTAARVLVGQGWPGNRYENLAVVVVIPNAGVVPRAVETTVYEEIERLAAGGPGEEELAGVKRVARAEHLREMRDNASLASVLTEYAAKTGDWREATRRLDRLQAVSAEDVQRVLAAYFVAEKRTVATLVRPTEENGEEEER